MLKNLVRSSAIYYAQGAGISVEKEESVRKWGILGRVRVRKRVEEHENKYKSW